MPFLLTASPVHNGHCVMGLEDVVVGFVGVESLMGGEIFFCLEQHLQLRGRNTNTRNGKQIFGCDLDSNY